MSSVTDTRLSLLVNAKSTPLQELSAEWLSRKKVNLFIKRDDLLSFPEAPEFRGNKWRKMKYNLLAAKKAGHHTLLTFGGAYSNHIAATAAAGKLFGFKTIGIIRGEETLPLNPTLRRAKENGMQFYYVTRRDYRKKKEPDFNQWLHQLFSDFYTIPEGGSNTLALKGCQELGREINQRVNNEKPLYITSACGTGGTFAGLISAFAPETQAIGFSALKGDFMEEEVRRFLEGFSHSSTASWQINNRYHFGGFARYKPGLIHFMQDFYDTFQIPLDPLYTGKMLYGLKELISSGYFPEGAQIVAVHTGGIQGIEGFNQRHGLALPQR